MTTQRWIAADARSPEEERVALSLRPRRIEEYVGQAELMERLRITIRAAKERGDSVEHILLHGPPGLGKTTLAHVIAAEMGSNVHATSGPAITRGTDLVGALTKLQAGDVLFIDEIHRLPIAVEEFIYPAMEDWKIDVSVDAGMHARTVTIRLKPFTLIGATTRAGLMSAPLRSRFGIAHHLKYYPPEELLVILERSAGLLEVRASVEALGSIAARSRGTPRIANRLLRRVRDYAQVKRGGRVEPRVVDEALALEGVDGLGLDDLDRAYLRVIGTTYQGGPVGLEAVAATMGEDAQTLEDVVEPFLLQVGFLARTRRGRMLTPEGAKFVGVRAPSAGAESGLFESEG
jgi:Holliday junction DNA helicase RuvB